MRPGRVLDPVVFAREKLGFSPDAQQERVLDVSIRRGILNCSRQWGKSTITAIKAVHWAYSRPGSNVLIASPSERQSGEFLEKARGFVADLGIRVRGDGHNRLSIRLPNGSRMVGLPGVRAKVRGFSRISLLLVEEAAQVADEQYFELRPMLAMGGRDGGSLWLMSTPHGKRGFFWEAWSSAEDWVRVCVPATENPRLSKTFLEDERRTLGERWFRQEYLCEFVETSDGVFGEEDIQAALRDDIPTLW